MGGTFDLFHAGHVAFLRAAKQLAGDDGDLVVALNTDEFAAEYKRPTVMSLEERMVVVGACRFVDEVRVNEGGKDSRRSIGQSRATMIVHGDDWTGEALMRQLGVSSAWLAEKGITLEYLPYTAGISSSEIEQRVIDNWRDRGAL